MARRKTADGRRLPKAVGVYDRPRVRRSTRLITILVIAVVAIVFVLFVLLR